MSPSSNSAPSRRAIVVGASSGIGAEIARQLALAGWRVILLARRKDELAALAGKINERTGRESAIWREHDATDFDSIPALFDELVTVLGGLDVLVYASGVMPKVEIDEYDFAKDRLMVEVNLLGQMAWGNVAAEYFGRLGRGMIVGVGSIAGDRGRGGQPAYNTSKGAQAIYLESLRNRFPTGDVRVLTIKPGYVETAMTAEMQDPMWMISAREAGRQIVESIRAGRDGVQYVPARWRLVALVLKHIPPFIFRKMRM